MFKNKKNTAAAAMAVSASLFTLIVASIYSGAIYNIDRPILSLFNFHDGGFIDWFMLHFTELSGVKMFLATVFLICGLLIWKKRYDLAALSFIILGGSAFLSTVFKDLVARYRPDLWVHLEPETTFSFPSSHAAASSAVAIVLILIFWKTKFRKIVIALASLYAILIAVTRLYIGVHYPSDLVGGWLLSIFWAAFTLMAYWQWKELRSLRKSTSKSKK